VKESCYSTKRFSKLLLTMKKEVLVAILAGFALGLIITFGFYRASRSLKQKFPDATPAPTQTETPSSSQTLTIKEPTNEAVVATDSIVVTGTTSPNSLVAIVATADAAAAAADELGNFAADIELDAGINDLIIQAFSTSGEAAQEELTVVFSTQFAPAETEKE